MLSRLSPWDFRNILIRIICIYTEHNLYCINPLCNMSINPVSNYLDTIWKDPMPPRSHFHPSLCISHRKLLPADTGPILPPLALDPHNLTPAPQKRAPVARLHGRREVAPADEQVPLAARDAGREGGVALEPGHGGAQVGPVGGDEDGVGVGGAVGRGPGGADPRRRRRPLVRAAAGVREREVVREERAQQVRRVLPPRDGRRQQHAAAHLQERQAPAVRHAVRVQHVFIPAEVLDHERCCRCRRGVSRRRGLGFLSSSLCSPAPLVVLLVLAAVISARRRIPNLDHLVALQGLHVGPVRARGRVQEVRAQRGVVHAVEARGAAPDDAGVLVRERPLGLHTLDGGGRARDGPDEGERPAPEGEVRHQEGARDGRHRRRRGRRVRRPRVRPCRAVRLVSDVQREDGVWQTLW